MFTNADYDTQMRAAADGLLAASFDPARDHAATAEALVTYGADTVFGMPSYLWQLFHSQRSWGRSATSARTPRARFTTS